MSPPWLARWKSWDMLEKNEVITIDGPSGSGKSTISRMVASRLGFTYLDTGAMYRAVGLKIHNDQIDPNDPAALQQCLDSIRITFQPNSDDDVLVFLNGTDVSQEIRTPEMSMIASRVSAFPLVREKLVKLQQEIGKNGGIVAEGRDMGTVVFPRARFKFFLNASAAERTRRRCDQLRQRGQLVSYEEILDQIIKRDYDDSNRAHSPLIPAEDAVIIDTSEMDPEAVINFMLQSMARQELLDPKRLQSADEGGRSCLKNSDR